MGSVVLNSVRKSYGDAHVIKDVSLTIPDGEFCVLVGPSGCGKSTLLRMIAGLEEISGGEVHINERNVTEVARHCDGVPELCALPADDRA